MFNQVNVILRTVTLGALVAIAGWWTLFLRGQLGDHQRELAEREEAIEQLEADVLERDETIQLQGEEIVVLLAEVAELEVSLALLKIDHRVARVEVLEQGPDPLQPEVTRTRVRYTEIDGKGEALGEPQEFELEGTRLYVEAQVIKFEDSYVEQGDWLRGTSICLFRRAYGEQQSPAEGFQLDSTGLRPLPYRGDDLPPDFYLELWDRFWDYANDPEAAAEKGVRAAAGESPFMELRPGGDYRLELRASGGLTFTAQ